MPQTPASACASSSGVWKRFVGSREHARANQASKPGGTSGRPSTGGKRRRAHLEDDVAEHVPFEGKAPVIAANAHAPSDQKSVNGPGAPPTASCSGAMKFGVPITVPSRVGPPIGAGAARRPGSGGSSKIFAMPKSTSLTTYGSPSIVVVGPREEDVVRLQIAVNDARRVRPSRAPAPPAPMICATSVGGKRPARDDGVRERLALQKLHDDVRQPLGADAVVVDLHRVLGLELRRGARLDFEARPCLGLARDAA